MDAEVTSLTAPTSATLRLQRDQLDQFARKDHLSGISNRRHAEQMINSALKQSIESKLPVSLALLDNDEFNSINDTFGHHAGDLVIKAGATSISRSITAKDFPTHLGGDEFVICLPGVDVEQAKVIRDGLREAISQLKFSEPSKHATISVGLSSKPASRIEQLWSSADVSLYASKQAGRNRVTGTSE